MMCSTTSAAPAPRWTQTARRSHARERGPRVVVMQWLGPLMSAGNWMPTLVEMAGGINLLSEAGKHSPWMTWDDLAAADPDIIVIAPCGFRVHETERDMHYLTSHPVWPELRAVRANQVHVVDGNQYFNRPGPRLVESLEILAEIVNERHVLKLSCRGAGAKTPRGRCTRCAAIRDTKSSVSSRQSIAPPIASPCTR